MEAAEARVILTRQWIEEVLSRLRAEILAN